MMTREKEPLTRIFILLSEKDDSIIPVNAILARLRAALGIEYKDVPSMNGLDCYTGRYTDKKIEIDVATRCSSAFPIIRSRNYDLYVFSVNEECFTPEMQRLIEKKQKTQIIISSDLKESRLEYELTLSTPHSQKFDI